MPDQSPIRPTDDEARALARRLIAEARHGALAVTDPDTGAPYAARIAVGRAPDGRPMTLISDLSHHTKALRAAPDCALLLGEPGPKGDPLSHPRVTIQATARFVGRDTPGHDALAAHYLETHRKAKLFLGFSDFGFVLFEVQGAHLNGGFGEAFRLTADDLRPQ